MRPFSIFIGYDPREAEAFAVCRYSIRARLAQPVEIFGLELERLTRDGLYKREHELRGRPAQLWDRISAAPMSTEHAIARFLVPHLAGEGLALFMDGDMLVRGDTDLGLLPMLVNEWSAVSVVKHRQQPTRARKKNHQKQTSYSRKNWSSFMVFNCDHPANKRLTLDLINGIPGRDLHRFCWLEDEEIGTLPPEYNFLIGVSDPNIEPKVLHFTEGGPWLPAYRQVPYAREWKAEQQKWLHTA
jgi:hypothetical protein